MSLKIDGKGVIRLGDATSHGGSVVQASGILKVLGIPVARIGDSTVCPLCKGTFPIVEDIHRRCELERSGRPSGEDRLRVVPAVIDAGVESSSVLKG